MNEIKTKAPCKINLSLDITDKRFDGYHLLESIFQTVSIFDYITVKKTENNISVKCDALTLDNENNTCFKAAKLFFDKTKIRCGAEIIIDKHIPSQAGLGGGSSDAAAVLKALNLLYNTDLTDDELCEIGAKIGADVPFFILGNTAYVSGVGEIIKPIKPICDVYFVIAKGKDGISTPMAYKKFDELDTKKHTDTKKIIEYIENADLKSASNLCINSLENCAELEDIFVIKDIFNKNGALLSLMSGSGSAVFGMFKCRENAEIAKIECEKRFAFTEICTPYYIDSVSKN